MKNQILFLLFAIFILTACSQKSDSDSQSEEATQEPWPMGEVSYSADSITMNGYIAFDTNSTDKRPGILVVHEWWGHNEYARYRADKLAELGYVALAVDMYGDGKVAGHPDDAGKFAMEVMSDAAGAQTRFEEAINVLKNHPGVDSEKIGAVGYCFGGSVVLTMASAGKDLDAVAAFHAGLQLPVQPEQGGIKARILVCNGADDPFISEDQIIAFKESMDGANANYTYISYPGAVHSFTSPFADSLGQQFQLPLAYNEEADKASWEEMQKLFNEVF